MSVCRVIVSRLCLVMFEAVDAVRPLLLLRQTLCQAMPPTDQAKPHAGCRGRQLKRSTLLRAIRMCNPDSGRS